MSSSCQPNRCKKVKSLKGRSYSYDSLLSLKGNPPVCDNCDVQLTVEHILEDCIKFISTRLHYVMNKHIKGTKCSGVSLNFGKFHFLSIFFLWVCSGLSYHVLKYFYEIRKNKKLWEIFHTHFLCIRENDLLSACQTYLP